MRILVVEDDKDLNRQISEALSDAGYVVDRAYDGEEGHFLGDTEPYDAVVLGSLAVTPWPSTAYADDCYAVGVKLAADKGGQLARAIPAVQDGKPICRIVILLPGKDGSRPRRAEFIVPADKD